MGNDFGSILSEFKQDEEPENIMAMIDDKELQQGMIAWKSVRVWFKPAKTCEEKDKIGRWMWLWDMIDYDQHNFEIVAGVRAQEAGKLFTRLKGLHLIYPDGTINQLATSYLQSIILSKIRGNSKKEKMPTVGQK